MSAGMPVPPVPRLHLISDRRLCPLDRFAEIAGLAVSAGFDAVHLREKNLGAGALVEAGQQLRQAVGNRASIIVNERLDVALVLAASGVQLGEESFSPRDVRAVAGRSLLIGRSIHDPASAERAALEGADFLIAGHIYATSSKPEQEPRGPELIRAVVRACRLPVIAIGGITPERVPEVVEAGARGVAVISGVLRADDPAEAARAYRAAIDRALSVST